MKLCAMAHIPLAAGALGVKTGGSRRRHWAVAPAGLRQWLSTIGLKMKLCTA